jgi:hypothetical protein
MAVTRLADIILNGGNAVTAPPTFTVPVGQDQTVEVRFEPDPGAPATVAVAWWVPTDGLTNLFGFDFIEVSPSGRPNILNVRFMPNREATLGIAIYGE